MPDTIQQSALQRIAADFAQRERERHRAETALACQVALHTIARKHTDPRTYGRPIPLELESVLGYGCQVLGIPPRDWPRAYLVPAHCLSATTTGQYRHDGALVAVREDLDRDEQEATLLHELLHHWQNLRGKASCEAVVVSLERDLFRDWCAIRRGRYPHRYAA